MFWNYTFWVIVILTYNYNYNYYEIDENKFYGILNMFIS
jgi:hypothetical protein